MRYGELYSVYFLVFTGAGHRRLPLEWGAARPHDGLLGADVQAHVFVLSVCCLRTKNLLRYSRERATQSSEVIQFIFSIRSLPMPLLGKRCGRGAAPEARAARKME